MAQILHGSATTTGRCCVDATCSFEHDQAAELRFLALLISHDLVPVYTENPIRIDDVMESPKLAE